MGVVNAFQLLRAPCGGRVFTNAATKNSLGSLRPFAAKLFFHRLTSAAWDEARARVSWSCCGARPSVPATAVASLFFASSAFLGVFALKSSAALLHFHAVPFLAPAQR
jgi:hypothetical protein